MGAWCAVNDPLEQFEVLDCTGRATHILTLQCDGTVEVRFAAGHRAIVDPVARRVLTPGMTLHPDLVAAAAGLRPHG
jgi:hypothetical protein